MSGNLTILAVGVIMVVGSIIMFILGKLWGLLLRIAIIIGIILIIYGILVNYGIL